MLSRSARTLIGKRLIVTGASHGLGFAAARACLERGATVAICARNIGDLDEAALALGAATGRRPFAIAGDVSDAAAVERIFEQVIKALGGLDGVVHAAGILGPIGSILDVDPEQWFATLRVNLFGALLVARAAARQMKDSGGGRIVLFSGGGAATPFPNYTAYACGKVGVVRLTETIAIELAPFGIEVNAVAPGFVVTRMHDQTLAAGEQAAGFDYLNKTKAEIAKGGVPVDVGANCAAFLVSDLARGITGKFVAAPYDGYSEWPSHLDELRSNDIFTLRRILPKDRGMDWQ